MTTLNATHLERRRWTLGGQVQGVGFRPFVYRIATESDLCGSICNTPAGVVIDVQGAPANLESFCHRLLAEAPPLARVAEVRCESIEPGHHSPEFKILSSTTQTEISVGVTPDAAVCDQCLEELHDTTDDRHAGYPLLNCTNCGPRFSIVRSIPYDRANTTMASFALCPQCRAEYENPADRRFHAQPTACHHCGPKVQLIGTDGTTLADENVIQAAAARLMDGQIIAIKGIGGYHLACRADLSPVVHRLRTLKHRPTKPLALMVRSAEVASRLIALSDHGRQALTSPAAPIVIARMQPAASQRVCPMVSPDSDRLGVMIPSTPLHHLLFDALPDHDLPLVMTSANDGDEPIVFDDVEALSALRGLCDAILRHNRPIQRPVDDSVLLDLSPRPLLPLRRARGYVPAAVSLPMPSASPGVAMGAHLKSTLCVVRNDQAILSQHLGDLGNTRTFNHFVRCLEDFQQLFQVTPAWVAHDLHPSYLSTHHAHRLAKSLGLPGTIAVQHHHAHAAAVLAEHGVTDRAIAIVCDGTGYGTDGTTWGGELFIADLISFQRVGHLSAIHLPGGDVSARQPWRSALAMLRHTYGESFNHHPAMGMLGNSIDPMVLEMVRTGFNCAPSSSTGRIFDGVAALLGLCMVNHFEAEAPMALETAASQSNDPIVWNCGTDLDVAPLVSHVVDDLASRVDVPVIARRFHRTLAMMFAESAIKLSHQSGLRTVALSGGVMCNSMFVCDLAERLESAGLCVLTHQRVPANDGGIAFGQAAVAIARQQTDNARCSEGV